MAVCLSVTAIMLYMFRTLFASILRSTIYWLSAEAIDLGRPYWILHPVSCHTPEAATTVSKCFWGWTQKASETCRVLLQLLINILPTLHHVGSLYILTKSSFWIRSNHFRRQSWVLFVNTTWRTICVINLWYPRVAVCTVHYNLPSPPPIFSFRFFAVRSVKSASFRTVITRNSVSL